GKENANETKINSLQVQGFSVEQIKSKKSEAPIENIPANRIKILYPLKSLQLFLRKKHPIYKQGSR
ncbi:hypothetical protein N8X69_03155, partial [Opitutales bacterium]|nr:hypothetical protein [Opitutales bacterium]